MTQELMNHQQQSQAAGSAFWELDAGRTLRLPKSPLARRVRVIEGRLWLTADGSRDLPADDIWLEPGDEFELPASSSWLAEAWPKSHFLVLLPPQPASRNAAAAVVRSFSAGAGRRVSVWLAPASAGCSLERAC